MPNVALKIEHLSKSFGRFKAVNDVSFEVYEGEVFTLLGPSGCGKTTTLRLVAGLESPDDGAIYIGPRKIVAVSEGMFVPTHKRNLGMVFQSYAIWPHMTVFENVAYPLKVRGVGNKEIDRRVMAIVQMVGLAGFEHRPAPHMSGGQQQRVALARALVHEPKLLLLDEPFSNLDAKLREQMRVQLKELLRQLSITAIFVTHDQVEALSLSSRIAVMNAGRLEHLGTPQEIYESPSSAFVRDFLGRTVLLRGVVDGVAASSLVVRLEAFPEVALAVRPPEAGAFGRGSKVMVALRPEDIHIVSSDAEVPPCGCLAGKVETLLFLGDRYECRVTIGDSESLLLHAPRSTRLREGEPLRLRVAEEAVSVWPL